MVKAKTGRDCIQNPSDADASYDAHKGRRKGQPTFWHQGTVGGTFTAFPWGDPARKAPGEELEDRHRAAIAEPVLQLF